MGHPRQTVTIQLGSEMLHCIMGCPPRSKIFILGSPELNDLCFCATISVKLCIFQHFGQWQYIMKYPVQPISFHSDPKGIAMHCGMSSEFNDLIFWVKIVAKMYVIYTVQDSRLPFAPWSISCNQRPFMQDLKVLQCITGCLKRSITFILGFPEVNSLSLRVKIAHSLECFKWILHGVL